MIARFIRDHDDRTPIYTPINAISFCSWAAAEVGWFFPHARNRGGELKRQLIRACIAGIEAIWAVDARARIAMVEPLIHVVKRRSRPDLADAAAAYQNSQYEACDMLSATLAPELGGQRQVSGEPRTCVVGEWTPATVARSGLRSNAAAFRP